MLLTWKPACMFVGALQSSSMVLCHRPAQLLQRHRPSKTCCRLLNELIPVLIFVSGLIEVTLLPCLGARAGTLGCCPPFQTPDDLILVPAPPDWTHTSHNRCPPHTKPRSQFGALCGFGHAKGSHSMQLLQSALLLTLQAGYLHCSRCHSELKQVSITAAY